MLEKHFSFLSPACTFPSRLILGFEPVCEKAHWGPGVRDSYILHFVIHGQGIFNSQPVCAGEGFVIRPGQLHEYYACPQDGWQYFYVILPDENAGSLLKEYGLLSGAGRFSFSFPEHFYALYTSLLSRPEPFPVQNLGLSLLFMLLSSIRQQPSPPVVNRAQNHVKQAIEYIHLHYHQHLSVSEIARVLFLDEGYLYNLFIRHLGQSPKAYLNHCRLEKACKLLKNTDLQIGEIARSVGYEDALQFSRFFKRQTGLSPLHYRNRS